MFSFTNRIENNDWFIFVCIILRSITGLNINNLQPLGTISLIVYFFYSFPGLSITNLTLSSFAMIILELKHKKALAMVQIDGEGVNWWIGF